MRGLSSHGLLRLSTTVGAGIAGVWFASAMRERARQPIEQGAVAPGYQADHEPVIRVLNEALATEAKVLRWYEHHKVNEIMGVDRCSKDG